MIFKHSPVSSLNSFSLTISVSNFLLNLPQSLYVNLDIFAISSFVYLSPYTASILALISFRDSPYKVIHRIIFSTCSVLNLSPKIFLKSLYDLRSFFTVISIPEISPLPFINPSAFNKSLILFFVTFLPCSLNNFSIIVFRASILILLPSYLSALSSFNNANSEYSNECLGKTSSPFKYVHLLVKLVINFSALALSSITLE